MNNIDKIVRSNCYYYLIYYKIAIISKKYMEKLINTI